MSPLFAVPCRSSLFNRTEYISIQEAIQKLSNGSETEAIPVQLYGKVIPVIPLHP